MEFRHEDRDRVVGVPPLEKPVFGSKFLNAAELHTAVVSLRFEKGGVPESGNGFFVHIPGAKRNFILTAGHNLLSKKPHTDLKIRLFKSEADVDISNNDVRVSAGWKDKPEEHCAAQDDYGVVLLPDHIKAPADFGFSLPLGVEDRLDCELSVTGYRGRPSPGDSPLTGTGICVNPIMRQNQLEYLIETEAGLGGSPVWVTYKAHPTVVAIHNHGRTTNKPGYGSKGARINLKCLRDIFAWTGVDTTAKLLRASEPAAPPLEPPLRLAYVPDDRIFRIVVDEVAEPPETTTTMLVSVFPVYAAPSRESRTKPAAYGFMQTHVAADGRPRPRWISWNVPPVATASLVDDLRRAWPGRPEGGRGWEDGGGGKDFAIVARRRPGLAGESAAGGREQMVTVEYGKVAEVAAWRLEEPGEVLDAVGYREFVIGRPTEGAYCRWVLESYSGLE